MNKLNYDLPVDPVVIIRSQEHYAKFTGAVSYRLDVLGDFVRVTDARGPPAVIA